MSNQAVAFLQGIWFLLTLPFEYPWMKYLEWRCKRSGGHNWADDWPEITPKTIRVFDYCKDCPAGRSRPGPALSDYDSTEESHD